MPFDRGRLSALLAREAEAFATARPRSRALFERAGGALLGGVPMPWMMRWAGGFPVFAREASGARIVDVDGHEYVDLCLGDTGAMPGHGPPVVVEAVGEELSRRFGLPRWLFTLTATDANRTALRLARQITGRPYVLVFSYCYHGSVDEAFAVAGEDGATHSLEAALAGGLVACVLAEPAMTNMGIILPDAGYHERLRELTRASGTLLIIDETHTFSAGPGGCTAAWGLEPDLLTIGKAIGSGIPSGALGLSAGIAGSLLADPDADYEDTGGVGGTLAGNALSAAAMRATLEHVLTEAAFAHTVPLAERFAAGVERVIAEHGLPWHVTRLGCRAEYGFSAPPPRDGTSAHAAADHELERYLHLHALNGGVMITPFHNMALMAPATSEADVDRHTEVFGEAVAELVA